VDQDYAWSTRRQIGLRAPLWLLTKGSSLAQVRMSVAQVAARWGWSRQHIYNMVNRGELPAFRIGTLTRLREEDVIEHEDRQCTPMPMEPIQGPAQPARQRAGTPMYPGYLAGLQSLARSRGR
jgi:excisionase family DNA binding protein